MMYRRYVLEFADSFQLLYHFFLHHKSFRILIIPRKRFTKLFYERLAYVWTLFYLLFSTEIFIFIVACITSIRTRWKIYCHLIILISPFQNVCKTDFLFPSTFLLYLLHFLSLCALFCELTEHQELFSFFIKKKITFNEHW